MRIDELLFKWGPATQSNSRRVDIHPRLLYEGLVTNPILSMKTPQPSTVVQLVVWIFDIWKGSLLRGYPRFESKPPGAPFPTKPNHELKPRFLQKSNRPSGHYPPGPPTPRPTGPNRQDSPTRIVSQRLRSGCQEAATLKSTTKWWTVHHRKAPTHMGVSVNGGTPKTPQNDHF